MSSMYTRIFGAEEAVLIYGALEDAIHHALKGGGRIGEAEEHDIRHKYAKFRFEGGFWRSSS
jgi:hypothetical protein